MKQLGGSDSVWFSLDTENTPMHITQFGIYGPEAADKHRMTRARLKHYLEQRIGNLPLRSKLLTVPFGADYPYWIEDDDFDLENHILQTRLSGPATWSNLLATMRVIAESPLDHSRPLWEMHLITGLGRLSEFPAGSFALAVKVHHGQFDGTNFKNLMFKLHTPLEQLASGEGDSWAPDRHPSTLGLLTRASWNRYRWWWNGAAALGKTMPGVLTHIVSGRSEGRSKKKRNKKVAKSPKTRFLCNINSRERVFDALEFPLADVLALRKLVDGATVNDVALAIAGGAVRKYLEAHGELPDASIRVTSPVSAHESGGDDETGNRISVMVATVFTDVSDPLERLRLINESTHRAKRASEKIGLGNIADIVDVLPTNLLGAGYELMTKSGLFDQLPVETSGISLTNVPGSPEPLYLDGFRLLRSVGAGFLLYGLGLMLIVTSYEKVFSLQFFTSPQMMPDPDFFRSCIEASYAELGELLV